jgi:hypothetical protein
MMVRADFNCTKKYDSVCCADNCPFCGKCFGDNQNQNLNFSTCYSEYESFGSFSEQCCAELILAKNLTCNETLPPCIMIETPQNIVQSIIAFFNSGQLQYIIPAVIGLSLGGLYLFHTCFIFGKKKPPINHGHASAENIPII